MSGFYQDQPGFAPDSPGMSNGPKASPLTQRKKGQRITEYIADRRERQKSYLRRRPVPFKRVKEMDQACETKSILIQISKDFNEAVYSGFSDEVLVKQFTQSDEGLKMTNCNEIIRKSKFMKCDTST